MLNLLATYRIQFHKNFSFTDFKAIIPYLKDLGIGTVYASPIFKAVPGSIHGYDVLDPNEINPEIGTLEQLYEIKEALTAEGIAWLQDIVPNHMAFDHRNRWLMDVLQWGSNAEHGGYFDIDWSEKLMVPFLGTGVDEALGKKELQLIEQNGKQFLSYYDNLYPVNKTTKGAQPDLQQLLTEQPYRLCSWKETDTKINYRRFFTINGLICLNIQDKKVFTEYHGLIEQLVTEGIFDGVRVDHIDGLYDPGQYLQQLRITLGDDVHVTVEKILHPGERLPAKWPIQGNTGYDFLYWVNNLFTLRSSYDQLTEFYQSFTGSFVPLKQQAFSKKSFILQNHMQGELDNLLQLFKNSDIVPKKMFASFRISELKEAIAEFLVRCPVYRFYGNQFPLNDDEANAIQQILNETRKYNADLDKAVNILEEAFLRSPHSGDAERNKRIAHFYKRCMQFTGPLMAKGIEDTLMYTYNRFIAHNEVGDQPSAFGISVQEFHNAMVERQENWPYTLNATATHDTKRGEDARARLNIISEIPGIWIDTVTKWHQLNQDIAAEIDPNDEYFVYQSLTGAYPIEGNDHEENFIDRFSEYLQKALREAKVHSGWNEPNTPYENAVKTFAAKLLDKDRPFWSSFEELLQKVNDYGIINSLSQVILKMTCPGIPDIYQGCELWDQSFVDPDNRRSVDYNKRSSILKSIFEKEDNETYLRQLWDDRKDGTIKLWFTYKLFQFRKEQPELFSQADYLPVQVEGKYKDHIISFARVYKQTITVIVLPLHLYAMGKEGKGLTELDWENTRIILPPNARSDWQDIIYNADLKGKTEIQVATLFKHLPFAILKGSLSIKQRGAGILLHITSLPSPFAIGDMGTEAKIFVDFLKRSNQKYWQILPLNPTEGGQGYSPYSSISSMAGNPLLISPELLAKEKLVDHSLVDKYKTNPGDRTSYQEAEKIKSELLNQAYEKFKQRKLSTREFADFCYNESGWLDDFALFMLLKQLNKGKPWFEWDIDYKLRNTAKMESLASQHATEIDKIKWMQFEFCKQWWKLKEYCNNRGIQLIGDMPIYVSYDSVDVWAHQEIFALDHNGNVTAVAGVPPDAFSDDGQLWGMPIFKWDVLKERNYDWWIDRIKRNMELFDLVRIDHFRAFSAYWEVPASEKTAKNGQWKQGPGKDFFTVINQEISNLRLIAEDLGDVDEDVFNLRDEFHLPGMKVLQFAFGHDMPQSVHIPHNHSRNFISYTGTHDNNTTRGWFKEADHQTRHRLEQYAGKRVTEENVAAILSGLAYSSVADIVILPAQDLLNLDENGRMNIPASAEGNWSWKMMPGQLNKAVEDTLKYLTWLYNR